MDNYTWVKGHANNNKSFDELNQLEHLNVFLDGNAGV